MFFFTNAETRTAVFTNAAYAPVYFYDKRLCIKTRMYWDTAIYKYLVCKTLQNYQKRPACVWRNFEINAYLPGHYLTHIPWIIPDK